ncbi:hypothetical protein [Piscinibacter defluvii]|uniref:hypothetical protein n=1 Tax=Piscinibacter defluvii TaxID=1796922 RepID=UPI000FDF5F28|nr:hypothetical protein [Piscinibacter defluvii]
MVMHLRSWLTRVWHWLTEIPTFWTFVAVLVLLLLVPPKIAATVEDGLRYGGLLLQLLGVSVVAYTLRGRGKSFGRTPVLQFAIAWLKRAPSLRPRSITIEVQGAEIAIASDGADATVWRGPRLDQSFEAQLDAIRENLSSLRDQLSSFDTRVGASIRELRLEIETERNHRGAQLQDTRRLLEGIAADTLYLEVAGLGWLVTGIIVATIPVEIASVLSRLTQ